MSAKDEKQMTTTAMGIVRWVMGASILKHGRNDKMSEEAKVEQIDGHEMTEVAMVGARELSSQMRQILPWPTMR